jgi:hypothetical protein
MSIEDVTRSVGCEYLCNVEVPSVRGQPIGLRKLLFLRSGIGKSIKLGTCDTLNHECRPQIRSEIVIVRFVYALLLPTSLTGGCVSGGRLFLSNRR